MPNRSPMIRPLIRPLAFLPLAFLLTGCALTSIVAPVATIAGLSLHGKVHGGQQPIAGAHVYLLAASSSAYGNPSVSLLQETGYADFVGGYVTSDAGGNFDITGDYNCAPNTQVYLYAQGGDAGAGVNPAVGLMAVLGNCPNSGNFALATPYITINEVSTVAAAYAMSGFAVDTTHVASSGSPLALTGIANAFANASNLVDLPSGTALATTPYGNATVPAATINTLANVIAACVNSTGSSDPNCTLLFDDATSDGTVTGLAPSDTGTAMINIAHNPGANMTDLFNLPSPTAPFAPTLGTQPNDFTIGLTYAGNNINFPFNVSIDASGNAWIANFGNGSVTVLSSLGIPTPNSPLTGPVNPTQVAIDQSGNAWVSDASSNFVYEFDLNGNVVSGSPFANPSSNGAAGIAIDPSGNVWVPSPNSDELSLFTTPGSPSLAQITGGSLAAPSFISFDSNGNAWIADETGGNVATFNSGGTPLTPLTGNSIAAPAAVTVDNFGNGWIGNLNAGSISVVDINGNPMPGSPFSGGGIAGPTDIALDGAANVWVANAFGAGVAELTSAGAPILGSPFNPALGSSYFVAIDGSGSVWIANQGANSVTELIGSAAPAVTPISYAVTTGTIGTLP